MDHKPLTDLRERITRAIQSRRISQATGLLYSMASATSQPWSVTDEIGRISNDYDYMCRYALDGVADPSRSELYASIVTRILSMADRMMRGAAARDAATLYFDTVRVNALRPSRTITEIISEMTPLTARISMAALTGQPQIESLRAREALETELFRRVWTTHPLSPDDCQALSAFFAAPDTPGHETLHLISALLLGLMEYYDGCRLELLLDLYMAHCRAVASEVAMRALSAIAITLWIYRKASLGRRVELKLAAAQDLPSWARDVKTFSLAMLRTRDTEKISRTVRDEVLPSMLKLRPDIYNKLSRSAKENPEGHDPADGADDANPEWEEMLERSGLQDKLRRLSEIQEQGGDVMMATFSHLKTFPFFSEIANWFLPFHEDHSAYAEMRAMGQLGEMLVASEFVCGSDRYSMLFTLATIPAEQRRMMMSQFEAQHINMAEVRSAELNPTEAKREVLIVNYLRDLYRFFHLFRRKGEFDASFFDTFNPAEVPALSKVFDDEESLMLIGEFFLRHGYYADALRTFELIASRFTPGAPLWQKIGYARQKTGDLKGAVESYAKAELLAPASKWTWRRLAACHRLLGHPEQALPYYERLLESSPDDLNLTLHRADAMAETGAYADALKLYFKVEFLDSGSTRALRPIAWTAFLTGDYDTSRRYFDRVMADNPSATDIMNLGHLEMATGNYRDALEVYRHALAMPGFSKAQFAKTMQEDLPFLRRAGVDDLLTGIVLDKLLQ